MSRFAEINVGDTAEFEHTISQKDLDNFVDLTGDDNPLHTDMEYARSTQYQAPVVHGMLSAAFISTMIGTRLPGKGALWCEQNLKFLSPVRVGETLKIWARVKAKSPSVKMLTLETNVYAADQRLVISGEAKVKIIENEVKQTPVDAKDRGAVIVSGASKGIGAAIALALAQMGYPIVINYHHSQAAAQELQQRIEAFSGQCMLAQADVADADAVQVMVAQTLSTYGKIYGVVNNAAGPINAQSFAELEWNAIQSHLDTQLKGAFHLVKACEPHMLQQKAGCIVNIGSIACDNVPPKHWTAYTIAKSALQAFSRSLTLELSPENIRVNMVSPGMTHTDLTLNVPDSLKTMLKLNTPMRKLAQPSEVANTVAFLFDDKASHITGENIRVCGGAAMV